MRHVWIDWYMTDKNGDRWQEYAVWPEGISTAKSFVMTEHQLLTAIVPWSFSVVGYIDSPVYGRRQYICSRIDEFPLIWMWHFIRFWCERFAEPLYWRLLDSLWLNGLLATEPGMIVSLRDFSLRSVLERRKRNRKMRGI